MAEQIENLKIALVAYLRSDKGCIPKLADKLENLSGTDREKICSIGGAAIAIYLVVGHFAALICNLIGFAYPAYASSRDDRNLDRSFLLTIVCYYTRFILKFSMQRGRSQTFNQNYTRYLAAIETEDKTDDTQWLTYWTVFAVFSILDFGAERICGWFPFYWLAKCIFLVYLYEPHFHGADRLYGSFVRPLIRNVHRWLTVGGEQQPAAAQQPAIPALDAQAPQQAPPPAP
uniref:Receptor expression-enhancing protein n=1 Tax=Romanomermis culicivorax TaxID=13658 RepID=A0A915HJ98_ROMCU